MEADGASLLVAHASQAIRETLCRRLEEAGYTAVPARDGQEALGLIRAREPDLAILDVHLPGTTALQVVAGIRSEKSSATTPVIVLAPDGEVQAVEDCLAAGAEDFLFAPYSATLLRAQVRDYLQVGSRRREEARRREREDLLKIERDVQIAREIQAGFLPEALPQPEGWEIAARFHPARQVAGDFYDGFLLTQGRRVGLVIADVCDKGVGAALFMALFRSLFRAYAQQHYSLRWMDVLDDKLLAGSKPRSRVAPSTGTAALKNAIELTNDYIVRNHGDANMFATTFFGVLDPATGQLLYVNGGHNPPAIVGADGEIKARLSPTGPAVGMLAEAEFRIGQCSLGPGDVLFTFTDGIPDARDPSRALFTEKRLLALLEQPADSAAALLDRVDLALQAHIGSAYQFDDITMLAVRRNPGRALPTD